MPPVWNQISPSDGDIPLIERPNLPHNQPAASQTIRRKPLPLSASLPLNLSFALAEASAKYSQIPQNDQDGASIEPDVIVLEEAAPSLQEGLHQATPLASWSPQTLKLPSLLALLLFSVVLFTTVVSLHWKSATHLGLGNDDGSSIVFFAWRFTPTFLAVIYVFGWMMLANDINRTEPFARLSDPHGSSATSTLSRVSGPWWSTLVDSFPNKKNDRRFSLVMLCSVTAYMLGFLVLSPLSAALLAPRVVTHIATTNFHRPRLDSQSSLQPALGIYAHFQTIGNVLQNVTTSAWITDQYTIVPFWPSYLSDRPTGAKLASESQKWRTSGLVLQVESTCERMQVEKGPNNVNYTYSYRSSFSNKSIESYQMLQTFQLSSKSGCNYGFASDNGSLVGSGSGGSYWSSVSSMNLPDIWAATLQDSDSPESTRHGDKAMFLNYTQGCGGDQIIVIAPEPSDQSITLAAHTCAPRYLWGNVTVDVLINNDTSQVTIDETEYTKNRQPIRDTMINVTEFERAFLSDAWNVYFKSPFYDRPNFGGPASLLGSLYNFRMSEMMRDSEIPKKANKIQQRAFGEAIQASLRDLTIDTVTSGEVHTNQRRIIVVQAVAFIIEAILLLHILAIVVIASKGRQTTRPLGLSHDPAPINTVISLIASQKDIQRELGVFSGTASSNNMLRARLETKKFRVSHGELQASSKFSKVNDTSDRQLLESNTRLDMKNALPPVLATWLLILLGFLLGAVLILIAVLYWYSMRHGLYQSLFVFEAEIEVGHNVWGTLAPYSFLPTLVAVIISLWWSAIESVFRTVQPFVAMAQGATPANEGSGISYQSMYLAWAASKALRRRHWLLALICVGALFTQILTIAMSALWQKQPSGLLMSVGVVQKLQLRQIPHVSWNVGIWKNSYVAPVIGNVFSNLMTNWMYSATIQLTLNGSEPPWSRAGWSFVPLDLLDIIKQIESRNLGGSVSQDDMLMTNVTVQTSAIRGRLECLPWEAMHDSWWLVEHDLTNTSRWNMSTGESDYRRGYEVGCPQYYGYTPEVQARNILRLDADPTETRDACNTSASFTPYIPYAEYMRCCAQDSPTSPGNTSIGYWTFYTNKDTGADFAPGSFTIKWLHGSSIRGWKPNNTTPYLLWPEKPRLAAAKCKPRIERANANVTVNIKTGSVQLYNILDKPTLEKAAWADAFVMHEQYANSSTMTYIRNVTTSYGVIFMKALLGAAYVRHLGGCWDECSEDLTDQTFNFRRPGLNVDYMTYSMLALAQNDTKALLDPGTLIALAQKAFTTFFQHFASSNVTIDGDGGWVYQRSNATLPADLDAPLVLNQTNTPLVNTTAVVSISKPIEILRMSPLAVWLCICILTCLLITTMLVIGLKKRYFSPLLRRVDTLADVVSMVASSERFLSLAKERGPRDLQKDKAFRTRLGWFQTSSGDIKWGIELVDGGSRFLSDSEIEAMTQKNGHSRYRDK